jgi:hypothetical protein
MALATYELATYESEEKRIAKDPPVVAAKA